MGQPNVDSAAFTFEPIEGASEYYVYYMPFTTCEYSGGACKYGAQTIYDKADSQHSCTRSLSTSNPSAAATLVGRYQARAEFESFWPMEMPMTAEERDAFMSTWPKNAAIVVSETRENIVKMKRQLPQRWVGMSADTATAFEAIVQPGEHFTFQLAVVNMAGRGDNNISEVAIEETPSPHKPFCVQQSNNEAFCQQNKEPQCPWYIKTGGNPNSTVGWQRDPGSTDPSGKCCRSAAATCHWFPSKALCLSALHSGVPCLPCKAGEVNQIGCPSWNEPHRPPPPNVTGACTFCTPWPLP